MLNINKYMAYKKANVVLKTLYFFALMNDVLLSTIETLILTQNLCECKVVEPCN
jgi:hypothetical protein